MGRNSPRTGMDQRQDVIQKTYQLLIMMERVTGYDPGEAFYKAVVESLNSAPEEDLPGLFVKIADVVTRSVDKAAEEISEIRKLALVEEEKEDRTKEIEEVSEILNF